jgi:hypothetical protein
MITIIVSAVVSVLFSAFCLWAGMKITKVEGSFIGMLVISIITTLLGLIPGVGWVLGTIAMFVLICKWTGANFWPDAILMVVVARIVGIFGGALIAAVLVGMLQGIQ